MKILLVVVALLLSLPAQATRLTPSIRLDIATTAGARTQSVDIPASATFAEIAFSFGNVASNQAPSSVTLDGHAATKVVSSEAAGQVNIALYKVASFATGAGKTLAWTNPSLDAGSVMQVAIEFRDGVPTYGASDSDYDTSGLLSSNSLANTSGDEIICAYAASTADLSAVGAGQTLLDDTSGTGFYYGFTTETGTGAAEVETFTSVGPKGYACVVVTRGASTPTFTSNPAWLKVDNNTLKATFIASTSPANTVKCGAWPPGTAAPAASAVAAGTGAHGTASGAATGVSQVISFDVTDNPAFPAYIGFCVEDAGAGNYGSVPGSSDTMLDPPSGKQYLSLTSIAMGSPVDTFNTSATPDIAISDIEIVPLLTTPSNCVLTPATNGHFSYSPGPGDLTQHCNTVSQRATITFYDYSVGAYHADSLAWADNNHAPVPTQPQGSVVYKVPLNSPMTPVDLTSLCSDADGDALTITSVDALPPNLVITNNVLQGTATTKSITPVTFRCMDVPGDYADFR